ncbi:MAG: nucleotidyltransferase family protein [Dehalococcoidia bacterium]|nr:nucleotidyltransferase family protein [Dehalococcoidia bacterium]
MRCLILAGGFATRLRPFNKDKPKPLLMVNKKPVITHIVEKVPQRMEITVSTNKRFEADFIKWQSSLNRSVELFVEDALTEEEKLGAIGSVEFLVRRRNIQEDLLIVAGDNYFDFSLHDFIDAYDGKNPLVAVRDIGDRDKAKQHGVVELRRNRVVRFWEKPAQPQFCTIAIACYILPATVLEHLSQYCSQKRDNLGDFIAYLVNKRDVYAFVFSGSWIDMGSVDLYLEAQKEVEGKS